MRKTDWKQEIKLDALMLAGLLVMMSSYNYFFVPNRIAPGGITGLATIFYHWWGVPVGLMSALLNIPLFLLSWRSMGRSFAVRSLVAMLLLSVMLDAFPLYQLTGDMLLASGIGGALLGVGLAMVLAGGASTGGTDLAAAMLARLFPHISFGWLLMGIEAVIVLISALAFGAQIALYAFVALFLSSRLVDVLQEGMASGRMFYVISSKYAQISARVNQEMGRGVTLLQGQGVYSGKDCQVIFCVVSRNEVLTMKRIVHEEDPSAFVVLAEVRETMGEGFSHILPQKADKPKTK